MSIRSEGDGSEYLATKAEITKDIIDRLRVENTRLRGKLATVARRLQTLQADVESTLWPNSVDEGPK